jgi:methionine-rich copper-binding protein CopC
VLNVARGIVLCLVLLIIGSAPASAHAALIDSDPEDGSSLDAAPTMITLTFSEEIGNPAFIAVTAPDGTKVRVSGVKAVDNTVTATVADIGEKGRYGASYRVVSADGHPVEGTLSYTVTSGRTVDQVDSEDSETFLHRHSAHLFWGILAAAIAIAMLLAPLRRRDDAGHA